VDYVDAGSVVDINHIGSSLRCIIKCALTTKHLAFLSFLLH